MLHYDVRLSFFMIELMVATLLFCRHNRWRHRSRLLVLPAVVLVYGCSTDVYPVSLMSPNSANKVTLLLYYVLCVVVLMVVLRFVSHASWVEALLEVCAGYAVQHIAYDVMNMVMALLLPWGLVYFAAQYYVAYALVYVLTYALAWLVVARRFETDDEALRHKFEWVLCGIGLLAFVIVVNIVVGRGWSLRVQMLLTIYDFICTVLALAAFNIAATNDRLKEDLLNLRRVSQMQTKHYEMSKTNIEQINIQFHDLRKRLAAIGEERADGGDSEKAMGGEGREGGVGDDGEAGGERTSSTLASQVQRAVTQYDSLFHTGNAALDVVLSEKSLYCSQHGIALTCMADGSALDFMDTGDLYALFGNMLDNAVEATLAIPDQDRRVIDVNVGARQGLVVVEERNFFVGSLKFVDGLPATTKADANLHGFGMKSMAQQVHKYGGSMQVGAQDGLFSISIVFPL